jgi:hypothetical protein
MPAAREAWEAANLTSTAIERSAELRERFRRRSRRRDPEVREALHLAIGALVVWPVGPYAWLFTRGELAAMRAGETTERHRGWLVAAQVCGIVATVAMIAAVIAIALT